MKISKSKIRNPQRYLCALQQDELFYLALPLEEKDLFHLRIYGLLPDSISRIPIARGAATRLNADGRWILCKDLPKVVRSIEHAYHIVDWHGNDHYGTCWQERWCYQRELIAPMEVAFTIEGGVLFSPLFNNTTKEYSIIKVAMNAMLEMVGHFEIWNANKTPTTPPVKHEEVPWEILRVGSRNQLDWEEYVKKIVEHKSEAQQTIIYKRHEHLLQMEPDFCVLGTQNFFGYVVYGFSSANLFVFECNEINNATYVFKGDWKDASKLTKSEVLSEHLHEDRIYHTEHWYDNIDRLVSLAKKGGA